VRITLLTYGSRGDVQPFVALARRLIERGHKIKLAGPHRFAGFAGEHSVPFIPLAGDPGEISRRFNDAGTNSLRMVAKMQDYVQSIAGEVARSAFAACEEADLIVHSFLFTTGAHSLARRMGIPDVSAQLFPMFLPTTEFPNVAVPGMPPGPLSYFTHWMANQIFWYGGKSSYKRLRKQDPGIFPVKLYWPFKESAIRSRTPVLGAWSPSVLPRPHDWQADAIHITGYWFLDSGEGYQPPAELADFLAAGEPPVCITFGSMIHRQADRIALDVMTAISKVGVRAVVLTGWQAWNVEPRENVLFLGDAAHAWLFPRCKLVVHHGGAGTTAAVLRAGVPSIVVPFAGDQLFWARRLHALGVAPVPIRVKELSVQRLEEALLEAGDSAISRRAELLGGKIEGEDGAGQAAAFIENHAGRRRIL